MILPPKSLNQFNRPVAQLLRLLDACQKSQRHQHQHQARENAALDRIATTREPNSAIASNSKLAMFYLRQYKRHLPSQEWPTPSLIPTQAHPLNIAI
jgi:hypothetical protein